MAKQNQIGQIKKLIETAHVALESARQLLNQITGGKESEDPEIAHMAKELAEAKNEGADKIVEGVFDGQNMIGPDGKQYSIPANYASKSKLVAGDTLKLTIKEDGSFMYKQIGPIDRNRLVGLLAKDDITDEYRVLVGDKAYKVLLASITYFKGESGDEVVILVPKEKETEWAAVENIIKAGESSKEGENTDIKEELKQDKGTPENVEEIEDLS
ncbi:MAG: hypothetical protein WCV50_02895 [Patescibacteria group bacterium]|jgi:hypothetical protein